MVHRTEHYHGTELFDITPSDKEAYVSGLHFSYTDRLANLWPKTKRWVEKRFPQGLDQKGRDVVEKTEDPGTPDAAKRKRAEDSETSPSSSQEPRTKQPKQ
ncbi:MAG: hypothetical protein Q9174_007202 [Haloplaca sp. 1 TL-2023]